LTIILILISLVGFVKKQDEKLIKIVLWFFVNLVIVLFFARNITPRYLVSFLPTVIIVALFYMLSLYEKKPVFFLTILMVILFPITITVIQVFQPNNYFSLLSKYTQHSQLYEYVTGWPSGYGVPETVNFLKEKAADKPTVIGVRGDHGNPESAMFAYFNNNPQIKSIFLEAKYFNQIEQYNCFKTDVQTYFVSRDDNLAGFDKFLQFEKKFPKPKSKNFISVYSFIKDCRGKSININFLPSEK
jgi:hypothetical protein